MTTQQYAISHWPDTMEILARLDTLVHQPMHPISRYSMG